MVTTDALKTVLKERGRLDVEQSYDVIRDAREHAERAVKRSSFNKGSFIKRYIGNELRLVFRRILRDR